MKSSSPNWASETTGHLPVLPAEVLASLRPKPGGRYLDGTLGGGGHARLLLTAMPDVTLVGCDRDARAIERCSLSLVEFSQRVRYLHADFRSVTDLLPGERFDGILLDLGVSSFQLDDPDAGFSFRADGPLDMRMDRSCGRTAAELVNDLDETELARILDEYGEERYARRVARSIVAARAQQPIRTTAQLAEIVRSAVPRSREPGAIDPATRSFQGLRIAVNDELNGLDRALEALAGMLLPGGRMAVIAFHSLEDRIVKWAFRRLAGDLPDDSPRGLPVMNLRRQTGFVLVGRKAITPTAEEQRANPRSRSARMRVLERSEAESA